MSTETRNFGEVEGELVLEPVDGVARTASKNADEVIASEFTSLQDALSASLEEREDN